MSCGIANGSKVDIVYAPEATMGTAATTGFKVLRTTKRNVNFEKTTIESAEVRADRQYSDVRHGMRSVGGEAGGELSYAAYSDLIAAAIDNPAPGADIPTFTVVRRFTDLPQFQLFKGCAVNTMTISVKPEQMATIDFGFVGLDANAMTDTAPTGTAAATAAATNTPMSGFDGTLEEGGVPIAVVTGLDLVVDNQRSLQGVVGADVSPCVFEGRQKVTGTATVMFQGATIYNKFVNETTTSMVLTLTDTLSTPGVTNTITITLPRVKYTGGAIDPPTEGPVIISMPFQALVDVTPASPTEGQSIDITEATVGP